MEDEDEDEEAGVRIPSDTYDGLICAACVSGNSVLKEKAGSDGWMAIEPPEVDSTEWRVLGRKDLEAVKPEAGEMVDSVTSEKKADPDSEIPSGIDPSEADTERDGELLATGIKRRADDEDDGGLSKKARVGDGGAMTTPRTLRGAGDVFLSHGVRDHLKATLSVGWYRLCGTKTCQAEMIASLPFPLEDAEAYEPPRDDDEGVCIAGHGRFLLTVDR